MATHIMQQTHNHDGTLLQCPDCGKRIILKRTGDLIVIDRGDFWATHTSNPDGLQLLQPTVKE